ncbi:hypothetical protein [Paenibacillus segetis]|uniref:Uncharacterized protein n=1 Tax=Paenibacillus segetis TaxID=1325360 RepID=A0ABQ1YE04_9BACL|nr:hypothetical protein [Paenibacillus segetis]GGH21015.1 hypothetical protein GCM10008013_18680 [Paenibacillus segetis]
MREGHKGKHGHREHREHRDFEEINKKDRKDSLDHHHKSAQTFRRGRAIAFLERLNIKRSTLLQQLDQPEFDSIKQVISGELKATDAIIQEFIHAFEIREAISENEQKNDGVEVENDNN